jgi:hypothetical protein
MSVPLGTNVIAVKTATMFVWTLPRAAKKHTLICAIAVFFAGRRSKTSENIQFVVGTVVANI